MIRDGAMSLRCNFIKASFAENINNSNHIFSVIRTEILCGKKIFFIFIWRCDITTEVLQIDMERKLGEKLAVNLCLYVISVGCEQKYEWIV